MRRRRSSSKAWLCHKSGSIISSHDNSPSSRVVLLRRSLALHETKGFMTIVPSRKRIQADIFLSCDRVQNNNIIGMLMIHYLFLLTRHQKRDPEWKMSKMSKTKSNNNRESWSCWKSWGEFFNSYACQPFTRGIHPNIVQQRVDKLFLYSLDGLITSHADVSWWSKPSKKKLDHMLSLL